MIFSGWSVTLGRRLKVQIEGLKHRGREKQPECEEGRRRKL